MAPSATRKRSGSIRWKCTVLALVVSVSLACLHTAAALRQQPGPALGGRRLLLDTGSTPDLGQPVFLDLPMGEASGRPATSRELLQEGQSQVSPRPSTPHVGAVPTTDRARCNRVLPGTTKCEQASQVLACCPPFGDQCFTAPEDAANCPEDTSAETPRYLACCN